MANLLAPAIDFQQLQATFFNGSIDRMRSTAYQTIDLTVNDTTTYTDSTDLSIPIDPNSDYIFESCLLYDTSATADAKLKINFPFANPALIAPWSSGTAITTATNSLNQQGVDAPAFLTIEFACGGVASGTIMSIRPAGWFHNDSVTGPLFISITQNTATAVNTILKQGSWIAITRVA